MGRRSSSIEGLLLELGRRNKLRAGLLGSVVAVAAVAGGAKPALAANAIYWANSGSNTTPISYANLDGTGGGNVNTSGATVNGAFGVAIDPAVGRIYWANGGSNTTPISYANLDGTGGGDLSTAGATANVPIGVVIDAGKIYWANDNSNTIPISYANLDGTGGGNLNIGSATPSTAEGVAIDPVAGRIYWANEGSNTTPISYANLDGTGGGNLPTAGATPNEPDGVAIDPVAGRIYWANAGSNTTPISYANLDGTGGGNLSTAGATANNARGVTIDPAAGTIFWTNEANNTISYANLNGSGGGQLSTAGATPKGAVFPALLEAPSGSGVPLVSGGSTPGSMLSCSQGTWASDLAASLLYRAPASFAYSWTLNGAPIPGANASTFSAGSAGSYACKVTATNHASSTTQTSAAHVIVGASMPPALTGVGQSHRRWRESNGLPHITSARRPPVGTTFRFTVNESVGMRFAFKQRLPGRRVNGRCVRPTTSNRSKPKCTRLVSRGALSFSVQAGAHRLRFQGRLSMRKKLPTGRYTVFITATNSAGQRATAKLTFTIVAG